MEELPDGSKRQFIGDELPKELERRLVLRLLSYWRELCGERQFPSITEIDPTRRPDLWVHCFVLDTADHTKSPVFKSIGIGLAGVNNVDFTNKHVTDVPDKTLVATAVAYVDQVLRMRVPISRGGEYFRPDRVRVSYRSILLPMSADGETVSGVLGAANCREIIEEQSSEAGMTSQPGPVR